MNISWSAECSRSMLTCRQDNGTAVSSVASRFLSALQDGEKMSKSEIDAMRNVLANAYLGKVIFLLSDACLLRFLPSRVRYCE